MVFQEKLGNPKAGACWEKRGKTIELILEDKAVDVQRFSYTGGVVPFITVSSGQILHCLFKKKNLAPFSGSI